MKLFTPNTDCFNNYYDKAKFLMAWRISVSFSIVFGILSLVFFNGDPKALTSYITTFIIVFSTVIYLYFTKNFAPIFWLYAISGTVLANFAMNYVMNFTHYVDFMWMIACILLVFVGIGRKTGILFIVLNALGIAYFFWFSLNTHIEILQPKSNIDLIGDYIEVLFAFFVIAYLLQQYLKFNEYNESKLKEANRKLEIQNKMISTKNEENITLIKEVHHRVKNNLQIIISLLRLQKGELKSDEAKRHFSEAINRIMVMSLIHKRLYQQTELGRIEVKSYLRDLSKDIKSLADLGDLLTINVNSDLKTVGLKTIVPLGLLINELLTNSIKHAFTNIEEGLINIKISEGIDGKFLLNYSDNGKWMESDKSNPNFGLELIGILSTQLEGDYERTSNNDGTTYTFTLNNIDLEK